MIRKQRMPERSDKMDTWKYSFSTAGLLIFLVFLVPFLEAESTEDPIVELKLGKVLGNVLISDENRKINAFRGIPYAKPPVKQLRFKRPEPAEPWDGILEATEDGANCIQLFGLAQQFTGDEDCLFLNVYTPQIDTDKRKQLGPLPVMVFFHGGGLVWGSGDSLLFGPQRLLDRDVILVTINYRLAAFGFMSTGDEASPGNYGFYDQVLALEWIRDNIAQFGGDSKRVTIFGESAGSISVMLHLLSPLSKGLFHAAIGQSGSPYCQFGFVKNPIEYASLLGESFGCPTDNHEKLVKCLRRKPALDIVVHSSKIEGEMLFNVEKNSIPLTFGAVEEKISSGKPTFLPENYLELLSKGNFNNVPVIIGINKNEGLMIYAMMSTVLNATGAKQVAKFLPSLYRLYNPNLSEKEAKLFYHKVYNNYFAARMDPDLVSKQLVKLYGDILFDHCTDVSAKLLSSDGTPVYPYKFTYARSPVINIYRPAEVYLSVDTVNHADELPYIFNCGYFPGTGKLEGNDLKVSDLMVTLWTNFAKNGRPSMEGSRFEHPSFDWESYNSNAPNYLNISLAPGMVEGHLCKLTPFWIQLVEDTPKREPKEEL